ncbi:65-kDa microtubule-associated protein 3 [Nymphaea colorata]|nr:65-kDa microtubule-associated protein 3 [Nymphaea colorata]XP_031479326.1 65-kDa microtubule-associated protein 3 [Nymphaea colorata]XP_031479335.1 65-kDa microtubule-associated protein 3 [Nymphaea colorata]XP_049931692.1 65-kDa microtubule-associated protein 3 [Nymphaea colorata]XP_049931696.1 65-kDa microtubule-associated protein 3 [Nymphaea colorata]
MTNFQNDQLLQVETTCGSLLYELQTIWDEVGEPDDERDKLLLELEKECLEVYRRKVDQANRSRAQLRQAIADSEAKLASICASMAERPVLLRQQDQNIRSLKEELRAIQPQLEEMQRRKDERVSQFLDVLEKLEKISNEIARPNDVSSGGLDETDLSLRKLEEFHKHLQMLQKEKNDRLNQVMEYTEALNSFCSVLGLDFQHVLKDVQPSVDDCEVPKAIDDGAIQRLSNAVDKLREIKKQRMQKLQDLATTMLELWNLMDTPVDEQQMFQNVTCNIAASEDEINEPNILSEDFINYVEAEVLRLEEMKESKMKDLVLKKRTELEDVCRKAHMVAEPEASIEYTVTAIESGVIDLGFVLEQLEAQIAKAKEEAFSRKEILEKVDKWLAACEEENWLEEYNRDENRYNAGRGAHLTLKRAEKARAAVNKLPAMVENLAAKTTSWERERGIEFTFDGVRLLSLLEEYTILRQEKEQERRRQRDQKRLQGQLIAEQEALFGSKPSPSKQQSARKMPRTSMGAANRRLSLGGAMMQMQSPLVESKSGLHGNTSLSRQTRKIDSFHNQKTGDGQAALSAGRRGLDVAGLPVRKYSISSNTDENEVPVPAQRMPFSPVSSFSSRSNSANPLDELNHNKLQNASVKSNLYTTPNKSSSFTDEENRTPKAMPIPIPCTPQSVTVPMQTAATPAPTATAASLASQETQRAAPETEPEIEYSFEEKRLAFLLAPGNWVPA